MSSFLFNLFKVDSLGSSLQAQNLASILKLQMKLMNLTFICVAPPQPQYAKK